MASSIVIVMIFLTSTLAVIGYSNAIEFPKKCKDQIFCDIKPSYFPEKLFQEYARELRSKSFIRTPRYEGEPIENIINDENNCDTRVTIQTPYIVRFNTTTKLVVQSSIFEQKVKQTECLNDGASCFKGVIPQTYTASCTPTYGTIKMYLYDVQTDTFEHAPVTFPVCCSCSFKSKI